MNKLKTPGIKTTVKTRVFSAFTVIFILVLVLSLISFYNLNRIQNLAEDIVPHSEDAKVFSVFSISLQQIEIDLDKHIKLGSIEYRESYNEEIESMIEIIPERIIEASEHELEDMQELSITLNELKDTLLFFEEAPTELRTSAELNNALINFYSKLEEAKDLNNYLITKNVEFIQQNVEHQKSITKNILTQFIFLVTLIIIVGLAFAYFTSNSISKQIKRLSADIDEITKGKLGIHLQKSSIVEIQSLIESLNRILVSLKLAVKKVGLSKGELKLGEVIKEKEAAEERSTKIFETSQDGMLLINKENRITDINPAVSVLLGFKKKELIGKNILDLYPKDRHKECLDNIAGALKGEKRTCNCPYFNNKKKLLQASSNLSSFKLGDQNVVLVSFRDITAQKEYEDALKKKNQQLERFTNLAIGREKRMIELKKEFASSKGAEYKQKTFEKIEEENKLLIQKAIELAEQKKIAEDKAAGLQKKRGAKK